MSVNKNRLNNILHLHMFELLGFIYPTANKFSSLSSFHDSGVFPIEMLHVKLKLKLKKLHISKSTQSCCWVGGWVEQTN
jgi:hypothetical protein